MLHERVTRRHMLAAVATGLPVVGLGLSASVIMTACQQADSTFTSAADVVAPLLGPLGVDSVRRIGDAWRREHPAERTTEALLAALNDARRAHRRWPWQPLPTLEAVIAAEYAAGETVLPDGWVIAPTEARLLALVTTRTG